MIWGIELYWVSKLGPRTSFLGKCAVQGKTYDTFYDGECCWNCHAENDSSWINHALLSNPILSIPLSSTAAQYHKIISQEAVQTVAARLSDLGWLLHFFITFRIFEVTFKALHCYKKTMDASFNSPIIRSAAEYVDIRDSFKNQMKSNLFSPSFKCIIFIFGFVIRFVCSLLCWLSYVQ